MKCKQCGAEIKNDEKFCRICGARLPAEAESSASDTAAKKPEKPKKAESKKPEPVEPTPKQEKPEKEKKTFKLPNKVIIIAGIVVIAIIIAVIAVLLLSGGGSSELSLDPNRPFVVEYVDKAVVYAADGTVLASVGGYGEICESAWNDTIVIRGLDTIVVSGGVATDLHVAAYDVTVSADGSRVAYIAIPPDAIPGLTDDNGGDLYTYDVEKGESTFIDSDVLPDTVVLSPDGSHLAYNIFDTVSDCEHTLFGKSTKEGERLLDCEQVFGVSNDGQSVYFANNGRFYSSPNQLDGRARIFDVEELQFPMLMNSTGDQLIFSTIHATYRIYGFSAGKLSESNEIYPPVGLEQIESDGEAAVLRTENFNDEILRFGNTLYYGDEQTFGYEIACVDAVGSESGRKVAYIDTRGNICVSKGDIAATEFVTVTPDETPTALFADAKLNRIYFTNDRGELWRLNGEKTEMVSAHASDFCMSESGTLYFLYDGVVLCRADGSERVSLGRMNDFLDLESVPQGAVVKLRSGEAIYYRDGSTEGVTLSDTVTVTNSVEVE